MPSPCRAPSTALRAVFAAGLMLAASFLRGAEISFTSSLSPEQQAAAGLDGLTTEERAALDQLVATEMSESRLAEGKVLSGTFASRRTEAERKETGLDRLGAAQLARLDELVATASLSRPKPKDRPRLRDDDVVRAKPRMEVHGSFSLTFGHGPGGSFRGAGFDVNYTFPDYGLTLGFGFSRYTGGFLPYGYYPGEYYSNPLSRGPLLLDAPDHTYRREDFSAVTGRSFRAAAPWGSVSFSRNQH